MIRSVLVLVVEIISCFPDLVVLDGFTRNKVEDIDIFYHLGDTSVTINQNTTGIYNVTPEIIPVNNSNGVGINLSYTTWNQDCQTLS